jgi:hypothetical protein
MIPHDMTGDDMLSLSMFWAGALMVFTPLIGGGIVLGVWWRQRRAAQRERPDDQVPTVSAQERGSTTRPT